jgi:hypothetical protein
VPELKDKSRHIFAHGLVTYVVDFAKKLCWLIDVNDKEYSISTLELKRKFPSRWFYRHVDTDCEFAENFDDDWTNQIESRYRDYINTVVAGEDRQQL